MYKEISIEVNNHFAMELAQTSRGAQNLLYGGYGYILDKNAYDRKFWRCEERRQCKGRITTNIGCTDIKKPPSAHNHPPDAARVIAIKAVTAIKQRATTSEEATSSVINTCTQDVPLSAAVAMPRNDNLARMVRRKRQAPDGEDIQIMHTTRGQEFVSLHDDGVVIFTTMDNLNFLRANRNWFCDGTFDSAPEQHQLFTIHALLRPPTLKLFIFFRNFRIIRWYFFRSFRSIRPYFFRNFRIIRRYFFRNFRIIRQDTIIANTYKKKTFLMASSSITPYSHSISTFLLNKKMVQQALKITYLQE